ncbi:MAG: Calx-beta domain-containing protein, partial [Luteolibacter sp.]
TLIGATLSGVPAAKADWREKIGFTRLQLIAGADLPTAPALGIAQVEANESSINFKPDTTNPLFTGKTFIDKSGTSGVSGHATTVATFLYGSGSQLPGACGVDLYSANGWLNSNFLKLGTTSAPATETRAVQNHSWIGTLSTLFTAAQATDCSRRLDFAIQRDGFVSVVGVNNGTSTTLPAILCQTYNTISVGRSDGSHSAGLTTIDGSSRTKPDIVAPESATSWATPMVGGAAAILREKLASTSTITGANLPRVAKALLLASATKNTVPTWSNTSANPLDPVYGAGELNVCLAYTALRAGRATASTTTQYSQRGWAAQTVTSSTARTYYFKVPAGATSTPFCAALTWHRIVGGNWGFSTTSTLRNLTLRLYRASGFTLGTQITASTSAVDNVELIYQPELAPGDYALRVENATNNSTEFALAWHSLPAVTVATTAPTAREIDGQSGQITLTRTGDTTLPLLVPLTVSGSAISGAHFQPLPASVTFPAGQAVVTLPVIPIADSIAQGTRSVIVAAAADFASVRNATQAATVTIEDKPADTWRVANFSPAELANPTFSGDVADPDGDGLPNLIEYALNFAPKSPNTPPPPVIDAGDYLSISVPKNPAATDITWGAQVGDDFVRWGASVDTHTPTTFSARDSVKQSAADRRFIRLKISRP